MANLDKVIKVTQSQYNTLAGGGTVGPYTGLSDDNLYLVEDNSTIVNSVNGYTGNVNLDYSDVGAAPEVSGGYLPKSGGAMTGDISYTGSNATSLMIHFMNNTSNNYGNGIAIGGGGRTVVGAGEAAELYYDSTGDENLYLVSDEGVYLKTNCQSGDSSSKTFTFSNDGNLSVPGTITSGGTAVSLNGHTHSYLPLSGGDMTGSINWAGATQNILQFARTDNTWRGGYKYSWSGNSTQALWGKHTMSQFVWNAGIDFQNTDVNGTSTKTYDFQIGRDASGSDTIVRVNGSVMLKNKATMQYNSSEDCIDFIFN